MKVSGEARVTGPPAAVFERLQEPELLARCIPGCEAMTRKGPGVYEAVVKVGIGSVKGTFKATVTLSDLDPPNGYSMGLEGKSPVGHAKGTAGVALAEVPEGTLLTYDGDARVSGLIAAVGQRLLGITANKMAREFFERVRGELDEESRT